MNQYTSVTLEQKTALFWKRVLITPDTNQCWIWTGGLDKDGYGQKNWYGKRTLSHRVAWVVTYGDIPKGLQVLHKCDVPACCNPTHLFLGTQKQNMEDKVSKGRHLHNETHPMHKLSLSQIQDIREQYATGKTSSRKLGREYGVTKQNILCIVNRRTWRDV